MRKTTFLKTFLVALGMLVGTSAWAETFNPTVKMTYISGSDANVDTSYGEVTTAYCGYNNISGGNVGLANKNWGVNNIAYLQVDASAIPAGATITAASLTMVCQKLGARNLNYGVGYHSTAWSSTMTWNTADRSITTMDATQSVAKSDGEESKTFDIMAAFSGDADNIVTIIVYQTAAGGGYVKNPSVTITYTTETAYSITFAETNSVAATVKIGGVDVTSGTLLTNGTYDFTATAVGYKDYAGSFTVSGADKEVSFTMTAKAVYNYTVKGVDGSSNDLGNVASGSSYEDDEVTIAYPRWILNGTTLYSSGSGAKTYSTSFTLNADNYVKEITYNSGTVSDVVFYTEGENVPGVSVGTYAARASNANMGHTGSATTYKDATTLSPGKYRIYMRAQNGNSAARDYNFKVGENVVLTGSFPQGTNIDANSDEFTVYETSTLSFASVGSSASGIDYFYIVKTGEATVPVTIAAAGWASLFTPYALDFSGVTGLTAYTATVSGTTVTLTKVENVPANTGVVLKGAANTYVIPVITSSTTAQGDLKGSTTDDKAYDTSYDYYYLALNGSNAKFKKLTSGSIAAGKAYLQLTPSAARELSIVFDDETTGVRSIDNGKLTIDNSVYDLSGRRVAKPTKGLYIVNGKKVAVK